MASLARARPALTRATIISRSNSEKMPNMPNMARPAGVVVSTDCNAEHAKHGAAGRCGGIDRLRKDEEPNPGLSDCLQHLDQVLEGAPKPIGRPYGDHFDLAAD